MPSTGGLNFVPSRPRVEVLEDYASIVRHLYSPKSYFDRVLRAASLLRREPKQCGSMRGRGKDCVAHITVIWRLGFGRGTAWYFWRNLLLILGTRPKNFEATVHLMALFLHFRKHTLFVLDGLERKIARPLDVPATQKAFHGLNTDKSSVLP